MDPIARWRGLRMLHVGRTADVATSPSRRRAFEKMGFDVTQLDLSRYVETGGRLTNHLRLKFSVGPGIRTLNHEFIRLVDEIKPHIIWVDKGLYLWPQSIRHARKICDVPIVHLNPDDPFGGSWLGWKNFLKAIPAYDIHAVARDVNLAEYTQTGAKRVIRYHWAFDSDIHHSYTITSHIRARLGGPVGFIGDWEEDREAMACFLAEQGIPVRIWGPRWQRKCRYRHENLRIEAEQLTGPAYAQALCAFDVNLGFLRKLNRDLSTTRSVEIPACGAFLLGERTTEHLAMFQEGEEAMFFESRQELLDQTRFFLKHESERKHIAQRGRERCIRSGYDHQSRQIALLMEIEQQVGRLLGN